MQEVREIRTSPKGVRYKRRLLDGRKHPKLSIADFNRPDNGLTVSTNGAPAFAEAHILIMVR